MPGTNGADALHKVMGTRADLDSDRTWDIDTCALLLHWLKPCHASEDEGFPPPPPPFMKPVYGLQSGLEGRVGRLSSSPQERRREAFYTSKSANGAAALFLYPLAGLYKSAAWGAGGAYE